MTGDSDPGSARGPSGPDHIPPFKVATGSTGNAVFDGGVRGLIAAAIMAILGFVQIEYDVISAEGLAALAPAVTFLAFLLGGFFDRYIR